MSHMANLAHLANLVPGSEVNIALQQSEASPRGESTITKIMGGVKPRDKICRREEEKVQLILWHTLRILMTLKLTMETRNSVLVRCWYFLILISMPQCPNE